MKVDILIIGAGFAGSVVAERLANAGKEVLIIDKRLHIGGNAYDEIDSKGIRIHRYGPHIFHTQSKKVYDYLSRFTRWRHYEHKVLAYLEGKLYPIPINLNTINKLYNLNLDESGVKDFYEKVREIRSPLKTSEDVILNAIGHDLCEKFFRGYTQKQWGLDLSELDASITRRVPIRTNCDDQYFQDKYQLMPLEGYTKLFERMLEHPKIHIEPGVEFTDIKGGITTNHIVYTGPIDAYFKHCYGKLPYRSLRFEHLHLENVNHFQPVGVVNYPNDYDFTRITEFKHLTGQTNSGTSIIREYPQADGEPYYPILQPKNIRVLNHYLSLARKESNVSFIGRLGEYSYYNMDQVVSVALKTAENILIKMRS